MLTHDAQKGRVLADRLGLTIIGTEGHDLKCCCPLCSSSDGARLHEDTGAFYCFACSKGVGGFDLCKILGHDHKAAIGIMREAGLFQEYMAPHSNGNGHAATSGNGKPAPAPAMNDEEAALEVCRLKRMPPDAVKKYGGEPFKGGVSIPMYGPDLKVCSHIHITPANGKGLYSKGKPTGLFFPGRAPDPGEDWLIVEGPKDAAALSKLGRLVAGLPGNRMKADFAPLFKDCDVSILADGDQAGREGAAVTAKLLRGVARSVRVATFPDGKDARDVLAQDGPEGIGRALLNAGEGGEGEAPSFVNLITCPELIALDLKPRFLVRGVMVEGQPMIVGGRSKTLKTSVACDLIVSLGSGTPFLGRFDSQRVPVGYWSGESGAVTIRETAQRQAAAKGIDLAGCSIFWSFDLPKLSERSHLEALATVVQDKGLKVVVIDPLYLSLLNADTAGGAGNLFMMGATLEPLTRFAQAAGTTLVVVHHFRKNGPMDDSEPAGLEELSQSGAAEWCRQWALLQRRTPYQGDGHHELWARFGGSAGHGSLWGVTIEEGLLDLDTFTGRRWEVTTSPASDTRAEAKREKESRKAAVQEKRDGEQRSRLLTALNAAPVGDTSRALRVAARLNPEGFDRAILALIQEGRAENCEIAKGKRKFEGFRPTGK